MPSLASLLSRLERVQTRLEENEEYLDIQALTSLVGDIESLADNAAELAAEEEEEDESDDADDDE
jgi:hypothetical protein